MATKTRTAAPTRSSARRKPSVPAWTSDEVTITGEKGDTLTRRVRVHHVATFPMGHALGSLYEGETVEHRYEILVDVGADSEDGPLDGDDAAEWSASRRAMHAACWQRVLKTGALGADARRTAEKTEMAPDTTFSIAVLHIAEISRAQADASGGWYDALDSVDGDLELVGDVVTALADGEVGTDDDDFSLGPMLSDRLYVARSLSVHPAARGQNLGIRLLRHAVLELLQGDTEAMVLCAARSACAYETLSQAEEQAIVQHRSASESRALADYYAKLGFQRYRGDDDDDDDTTLSMYLTGGMVLPGRIEPEDFDD